MKKSNILLLTLSTLLLTGCFGAPQTTSDPSGTTGGGGNTSTPSDTSGGGGSTTSDTSGGGGGEERARTIQDSVILHAWNWNISGITSKLDEIKNAGFDTIQLSPMQAQKDYYNGQTWPSQWWKLYQPLGFSIAQSNQNVLGTKSDIQTLCTQAKAKGIRVIVDIVANHLAGGDTNSLNGGVESGFNDSKIHKLGKYADDNDQESIVRGNIGNFPDLKTEDSFVQGRVLSLLKEYIDVGISGFRFDAAKHIETSKDGNYASNFWENTLGEAKKYYKTKHTDEELYAYGEILTTCGNNRSYSYYTDMMSVIDNKQGERVLNGIKNKSLSNLTTTSYETRVAANKLVLWAESHDTYANDNHETTYVNQVDIDKAYVIQASRKDATSLYFARPNGTSTRFGDIDNTAFKSNVIKAANTFHNMYVDKKEELKSDNGAFINIRGEGKNAGALIVSVSNNNTSYSVNLGLSGEYTDLVSGRSINVNGSANITFTNGVAVLVPKGSDTKPTISLNYGSEIYSGAKIVTVNVSNASEVKYSINNGALQTLNSSSITLPSSLSNGLVKLKVVASNQNASVTKEVELIKTDTLVNKDLIIYGVDTSVSYVAWVWTGSGEGKWVDFTTDGNLIGLSKGSNTNYIVVKFNKGTTASSANWSNKITQTDDLSFGTKVVNYASLSWKTN